MLHRCSSGRASFFGRRALCCRAPAAVVRTAALTTGGSDTAASTSPDRQPVHVTIVGGGAAGLTAAFFAAEHGARVTVLERTREAGKKILMSGGSRCNVLPLEVDLPTDYFSESSASACRAVFASWNLELCKAWLEDPYWGVGLDLQLEEDTKKYFPTSNSSKEVRDRLVAACLARGVEFKYNASVEGLQLLQPEASEAAAAATAGAAMQAAAAASTAPSGGKQEQQQQLTEGGAEEAARRCAGGAEGSGASGDESSSGGGDDGGGSGGGATRRGKKGRGRKAGGADATAGAGAGVGAVGTAADDAPVRAAALWLCRLGDGTEHVTDKLIVATGGLSFPAVGTDGTGHRLLRGLGHTLHEPYPALTPLTGAHPAGEQLAGVSMYGIELSVQVPGAKRSKVSERTALLFTHRGYSGPAVLDLSHYAVKALTRGSAPPASPRAGTTPAPAAAASGGGGGGAAAGCRYAEVGLPSIRVNWTHEPAAVWDERIRAGGTALVTTLLQRHGLRERLAEALVSELGLGGRRVCDVKKAERAALVSALTSYELPYHGHEGYKKAEVTGGGVRLEEINCSTMESRLFPNLFLCGEVLDVFGRIGGFNFYWAWVSGRLAGIGAAQGGLRPKAAAGSRRAALAA
ncbi:hypothetical protein PLESTB_001029100 [Pleodorina starrii]|uniref:Uncharacterized protein n=1 Tax=Pleodorina starrii TaxID=330485 RepID=A0A9W6BQ29_9CHLO|nr:hypothetical protein PLESTM_001813000 [Pleodorina starrii]GLC55790.1 hypothetical protein PLESTB_001029100 [Pleodorina starrii]GLC68866.1 hypothetical protein PLESTF_000746900 [Pleodorina starrii]